MTTSVRGSASAALAPDRLRLRRGNARNAQERSQDDEAATSFVEYRNAAELAGFIVSGPIAISEITSRFGAGEYRVSAYGLDAPGLRWEVFATLDEDSRVSQVA